MKIHLSMALPGKKSDGLEKGKPLRSVPFCCEKKKKEKKPGERDLVPPLRKRQEEEVPLPRRITRVKKKKNKFARRGGERVNTNHDCWAGKKKKKRVAVDFSNQKKGRGKKEGKGENSICFLEAGPRKSQSPDMEKTPGFRNEYGK